MQIISSVTFTKKEILENKTQKYLCECLENMDPRPYLQFFPLSQSPMGIKNNATVWTLLSIFYHVRKT